ncbi:MAG: preprotein translocase subunit SecG [Acidobacteria bacterium]|nr:MAG: preprotein translocase subunit SecG [Acidobacteriota bacterium]
MKWALALLVGFGIIIIGFRFAGWLLTSFFVLNCLVLIIVVLLQSGKAADLAGAFGGAGSQTAFGPRGAANVLSKATTWCAVMFMVCAFAMVLRTDKAVGAGSSVLEKVSQPAPKPAPVTIPATPAPAPGTSPSTTPATMPANSQPASAPTKPATAPATSQPSSKPASQPPAASQPAPAQPKKP